MIKIGAVETNLNSLVDSRGAAFILLLDPDSESPEKLIESATMAKENGVDVIFMGGSFIGNPKFTEIVLGIMGVDPSVRMHVAVGTSLATIIPTSFSSALACNSCPSAVTTSAPTTLSRARP